MMPRSLAAAIAAVFISPIASAQLEPPGRATYLVEFEQAGMLEYQQSQGVSSRFDAKRPELVAYREQLMRQHLAYQSEIAELLARPVQPTHYYLATHSGMALRLSAEEAAQLQQLQGVAKIELAKDETIDTYRGPSFIGAESLWDGSQVPGGMGTRGEGMIIGVLDTGAVFPHPSFNNDAACGHGGANPNKVLSLLDCSSTDGTGLCNGGAPADTNGHGSHTASTSGGNTLTASASPAPTIPPGYTSISGVAPCANLRIYKVCPGSSCPGADIQAGMNSVLLHGDVDVVNFSISGGTSPWLDGDRRKLDMVNAGILVAASAGNTSVDIPDPVGQVNHRGPWVMSVAASTHDATAVGMLSASGPGTPPPTTVGVPMTRATASPNGSSQQDLPIRHFTGQAATMEGCNPGEDGVPANAATFPAGFFTGAAALIQRGTCSFTKKITNAFNAGAVFVVVRNNQAGTISMISTGAPAVPAYSIQQAPGNDLVTFVDANPTTATVDIDLFAGDVLANFSLRGPTPGPLEDLQKPNITGPGVGIYAATTDVSGYGNLSGTSMSSPHLAGAAALVRKLQPAWTPPEVISALQTTADRTGTKDTLLAAWDADDVGSGAVDLRKAVRVGLVMNETFANFLAANPGTGGDVKTLNLPSVRDVTCAPSCSFTRTVRNHTASSSTWNVNVEAPTGFALSATPSNFTIAAGATQTLTIELTPQLGEPGTATRFGAVLLTPVEPGRGGVLPLPEQHLTVAVRGAGPTDGVFANGFE